MKITSNDKCIYCNDKIDTTIHALLECPYTAQLWRNGEIWLRKNVEATIKLSEKEKIFGI